MGVFCCCFWFMLLSLLLLLFLVSPSSSLLILWLPFRLIALRRLGIQRREAETGVGNDCHDLGTKNARGLYFAKFFLKRKNCKKHQETTRVQSVFFSSFTIYIFARPSRTTSDDDPDILAQSTFTKSIRKERLWCG